MTDGYDDPAARPWSLSSAAVGFDERSHFVTEHPLARRRLESARGSCCAMTGDKDFWAGRSQSPVGAAIPLCRVMHGAAPVARWQQIPRYSPALGFQQCLVLPDGVPDGGLSQEWFIPRGRLPCSCSVAASYDGRVPSAQLPPTDRASGVRRRDAARTKGVAVITAWKSNTWQACPRICPSLQRRPQMVEARALVQTEERSWPGHCTLDLVAVPPVVQLRSMLRLTGQDVF